MKDIGIANDQDPQIANKIHKLAQTYRKMTREMYGQDFSYNEAAVRFLDQWIDHLRRDNSEAEVDFAFAEMAGAFFGECIRHEFGGQWVRLDDGNTMLAFHMDQPDPLNAVNVLPFNKVMNQLGSKDNIGSILDMYTSVAKQRRKSNPSPASPDHSFLREIGLNDIEEGKKLIRVSFSPSSQKADGKVLYATRLTNISQERVRILQFGGYVHKNQTTWLLNNAGGQLFGNSQFVEWYGQKAVWIEPGESVCDETNYGFPPVLWGYHFETFDGKRFSTGALLKEYPSETLARQVKLSKKNEALRDYKNPVTTFGKQALKWLVIVVILFFVVIYVTFSLGSYRDKYGGIQKIHGLQVALS
jgi:hypothetical protein